MYHPSLATTPYDQIQDDDHASYTGSSWVDDNAATGAYEGDQHYVNAATPTHVATWTFINLPQNQWYQVFITWKPDAANATNVIHQVLDGSTIEATPLINQQLTPHDWTDNGAAWHRLLVFKADSTTATVKLTNTSANGRTTADAVRIVEVGAITKTNYNKAGNVVGTVDALGLEALSIYDERDRLVESYQPPTNAAVPQYVSAPADPVSAPAGWETYSHPEALGGTYLIDETATAPANWLIGLPPNHSGRAFAVMATWAPDANNIDDAHFYVDQTGFGSLWAGNVNQQKRPADYQDKTGHMWEILTVFVSSGGSSTTLNVTADTGAQADGMMVIEVGLGSIKNAYDDAGQLTSSIDLRGQTTSYQYDALGRQKVVTLPDPDGPTNPAISPQTEFVYDKVGNVLSEKVRLTTAPTYLITNHAYDRLNRRISTTDANNATRNFKYDANGNLVQLNDPQTPYSPVGGNPTFFTFDALNRQTIETNVFNAAHTFEYDAASRMIKETDRRGVIIEHIVDNLGRQTAELWKNSSGVLQQTLSFTYDARGRLESASGPTAPGGAPAASYSYLYDNWDRPLQTTTTIAGLTTTVVANEVWDIAGRRTELRASVGGVADFKNNYMLDNLGRVAKITQQGQGGRPVANKRVEYAYNSAGDVTSMSRHSHLVSQALVMASLYVRDALGRATYMSHFTSSTFAAYQTAFDAASRMTSSSRSTAGGTPGSEFVTYAHDNTSQLTQALRNGVPENYGYDANGNRNNGSFIPTLNNRIYRDGTYEYEYDAEGNITRRKLITNNVQSTYYAYDHRNRLIAVSDFNSAGTNTKNVAYAYDVFNRRLVKSIDPDGGGNGYGLPYDPTYFVYDSDDIVLALKAGGVHSNLYLHGPAVDEVLADENTQNTLWALKDQFYSVRDLIYQTGGHHNHFDYDAFGKVTEWRPASQYLPHAYGFQTRERDQETGLNYHRNRYYNQNIGRWISEDPIGFAAGDVNLNRFVGNAPTRFTDPYGLVITEEMIKSGSAEYSCNCGWIDWTHAAPEAENDIWNQLNAGAGMRSMQGGGYKLTAGIHTTRWWFPGSIGVSQDYFIKDGLTTAQKESVFLAIWQEITIRWEKLHWWGSGQSSFSEEDLQSNLIHFYAKIRGYTKADIQRFCKGLGKEKSLAVFNDTGEFGTNDDYGVAILHPESATVKKCCPAGSAWPKELKGVKPAAPPLYRRWRVSIESITQAPGGGVHWTGDRDTADELIPASARFGS